MEKNLLSWLSCPCVSSRSRSQLKINYHTIKYKTLCPVRFVSPTLMKRFSFILAEMFTLTMCRTHVINFLPEGQGYTWWKNWQRKCSLILTYSWIFRTPAQVFAWNYYKKNMQVKVHSSVLKNSLLTFAKVMPLCKSLNIEIIHSWQYVMSA